MKAERKISVFISASMRQTGPLLQVEISRNGPAQLGLHAAVEQCARDSLERIQKAAPDRGRMRRNVYLHWFDYVFERTDGPAQWAKARLIRYAYAAAATD